MSKKSPKIEALLAKILSEHECGHRRDLDRHYLGYLECFNRGLYYEAHDVLEEVWLTSQGPQHSFYKGLIQLAGAFVHLQKMRLDPAARLLRLCLKYLGACEPVMEELDVRGLRERIAGWLAQLETPGCAANPYDPNDPPRLTLRFEVTPRGQTGRPS